MKTKLLFLFTFSSILSFAQTNLVSNGNLESWTDSTTLENWTIENNVSQNTTDTAEGTSSAFLSLSDNTLKPKILSQVPLESGIEYTITYKYKYVSANFGGSHPVTLRIVRESSATTSSFNTFASSNNWVTKTYTFTPDQTGDYDLSISIATFDSQPFDVLVDDVQVYDPLNLSVTDLDTQDNFKIYPTITEGKVFFDGLNQESDFEFSVFDTAGKKQNIKVENKSIDFSDLAAGMYFVNLKSETQTVTKRVIKK